MRRWGWIGGGKVADYYQSSIQEHLRRPPQGFARSAYAIEVNPWVRRGELEATLFFRGVIVSAVGYIETQIAELALRCSRLPQYESLRSTFPYSIQARLTFLQQAAALAPLNQLPNVAEQYAKRVERLLNDRNLMAHARMEVMPDWGVTF